VTLVAAFRHGRALVDRWSVLGLYAGRERHVALRRQHLGAVGLGNVDVADQHSFTPPGKIAGRVQPRDVFRNGISCELQALNVPVAAPPDYRPFPGDPTVLQMCNHPPDTGGDADAGGIDCEVVAVLQMVINCR
jgi:hypothetical protein